MALTLALLLAVHLLAASFWLGGMAFMLWIAPPALAARLPPEQQGPLRLALLGHFLAAVWIAMPLTLASGYALFALTGAAVRASPGLHAMAGLGTLMGAVFAGLYFGVFRPLRAAAAAGERERAARLAGRLRKLVLLNLGFGTLVVLAAALARYGH